MEHMVMFPSTLLNCLKTDLIYRCATSDTANSRRGININRRVEILEIIYWKIIAYGTYILLFVYTGYQIPGIFMNDH